jgi:hypothetical protein
MRNDLERSLSQDVHRRVYATYINLVFAVSLLFAVQACGVAKRATRSSETDALLRAARAGNADTVSTTGLSERGR